MPENTITIKLGNIWIYLTGEIPDDIIKEIQTKLSFVIPGFKFMPTYKTMLARANAMGTEPEWDGTKTVARKTKFGLRVPTGLLSYLREIFTAHNIPYTIEEYRLPTVETPGYSLQGLALRDYQSPVAQAILNRQRGVMKMSTGCHAIGQKILTHDGTFKKVENIKVDNLLMGLDGSPRRVLSLCRGKGQMYKVVPNTGKSFIVNDEHILSLVKATGKIVDISIKDYICLSECSKEGLKLFRSLPFKNESEKNISRIGFELLKLKEDNYYGFTLDGDGRYLLDDFTVTHNSGKTEVIIYSMVTTGCFPAVFYVPSCDLLEQTYDRFMKHTLYNGQPAEIGRIGNGHCDIKPITIATVQSCEQALTGKYHKYEYDDVNFSDKSNFSSNQNKEISELIREAQYVYQDEVQHASAETIQTVLNNSAKARFRIGGSASPWRDDGLDILIEACFGRRLCDIDASFLIKQGYLVTPRITFNHFRQYLGKSSDFHSHYSKFVVENDPRNQWIAERAKFHVERDRPTIILVKWATHAEILKNLLPDFEVLTSSGDSKKAPKLRKEILDQMRERKLMGIIGTTLLDEGVDVPAAGAGIMAGGGKSSTRALQRVGRLIRPDPKDPNKEIAYIEEFFDDTKWLNHHAKARRKIYETERLFQISDNRNTLVN
jgi:superfamily II DNA or RNA helicase